MYCHHHHHTCHAMPYFRLLVAGFSLQRLGSIPCQVMWDCGETSDTGVDFFLNTLVSHRQFPSTHAAVSVVRTSPYSNHWLPPQQSMWCTFGRWLSKLVLVLCVSWQLGNGAVPTAGVMAPNGGLSQPPQIVMEGTSHSSSTATDVDIPPEAQPPAPAATLVKDMDMNECSSHDRNRDLTGKFNFLAGVISKSSCISVIRRLQVHPLRTMSAFTKKREKHCFSDNTLWSW